jgi:hypothetical protein
LPKIGSRLLPPYTEGIVPGTGDDENNAADLPVTHA